MPRAAVEELCELVREYLEPSENSVREPVPLRKRVVIALYKMSSCSEYRVVASNFGVSKPTVMRCVQGLSFALVDRLEYFIKFPEEAEAIQIADRWEEKTGYPQAFGAIDGTHAEIKPPNDGRSDYLNRNRYTSVVLQALVDDLGLFRDVSCRWPGSFHDANIYSQSTLSKRLHNLSRWRVRKLGDVNVPLHILGDPAYPLSDKLVKTYTGRNLSASRESFNCYHSSARMAVENAFGRLKARWRILCKSMDCDQELTFVIVLACCCLHNHCEKHKTPAPIGTTDVERDQPSTLPRDEQDIPDGKSVRDGITRHLAATLPLRQSHHLH